MIIQKNNFCIKTSHSNWLIIKLVAIEIFNTDGEINLAIVTLLATQSQVKWRAMCCEQYYGHIISEDVFVIEKL